MRSTVRWSWKNQTINGTSLMRPRLHRSASLATIGRTVLRANTVLFRSFLHRILERHALRIVLGESAIGSVLVGKDHQGGRRRLFRGVDVDPDGHGFA